MDKKKILKIVFIVLFLSFIIAYVIEKSGYYEYNLRNKTVLTKESKLTRGTNKVSTKVNDVLKKGIESVFKVLGKFVYD